MKGMNSRKKGKRGKGGRRRNRKKYAERRIEKCPGVG